tara:strand:- start:74 stop:592 length:519 start_codon:yes stop_codon:yes gene_type:complete
MLKPLHSHKPAISTTFIPKDRPDLIEQLSKITFDKKDNLYKNYVDINWLSFEAISVYTREGDIVGFSTILKRDKYFDKDEVRILNRYYEMPKMRRTSKVIADDHVCEMVLQQIDMAKKLGYSKIFISREKSLRYFKKFIYNLGQKTKTLWNVSDNKIRVSKGSEQYKANLCY